MRLPVGGLGYSSEGVHLNGCAYQLVGLDTVLSGCTSTGVLTSWWAWIQFSAGALERVCLPVGGLGYSSERVHLNGCAYKLVGLDTGLSGCT